MEPGIRHPRLLSTFGKRPALRWLLVLLLSAELLTALHHRHAVTAAAPDCVACAVAVQLAGGVAQPDPPAIVAPGSCTFALPPRPDLILRAALFPHLLPFSQAPPPLT